VKQLIAAFLAALALMTGGGSEKKTEAVPVYSQITQEAAKEMMENEDVIILDVREAEEYDSGHIPEAMLFPVDTMDEESLAEKLPDKEAVILVYCRSGNRSKRAAQLLADHGYSRVYEFGGILTWPYEVE